MTGAPSPAIAGDTGSTANDPGEAADTGSPAADPGDASALLQRSATEVLVLLESRAVTSLALLDAVIARIESRGGEQLGAFTDRDYTAARAAARQVDSARSEGRPLGPLAGLPISIKDSIDVAGLRTAHGRLSDARHPEHDAPAVARLRDAGAIIVGKTNVPVYLNDHQPSNDDFGVSQNPWDPTRSPGGSSGGSSAAVAAGMSFVDLGSDLAGSLRVPASWCGLFGHKPSNGIVSKTSQAPWPMAGLLEPMISAVGPMTRSAADAALFFELMVGVSGPSAVGWSVTLPPPRVTGIAGIRVGLWLDDEAAPVDSETRAALTAFASALASAGAIVSPLVSPPGSGQAGDDLFMRLQASEVVHGFDDELWLTHVERAATPGPGGEFSRLVTQSFREGMAALEAQSLITHRWASEVFTRFDVVLCPAVSVAAPVLTSPVDEHRMLDLDGHAIPTSFVNSWSRLTNLAKLPSTVVPLGPGSRSGLPIGAQLLAPHLEDRTSLQLALDAEAAGLLAYTPPPLFAGVA